MHRQDTVKENVSSQQLLIDGKGVLAVEPGAEAKLFASKIQLAGTPIHLPELVVETSVPGVKVDGLLHLGQGGGELARGLEGAGELLMRLDVCGGERNGGLEEGQSLSGVLLGEEQGAEVEERLLAGVGVVDLPGDGKVIGGEGFGGAVLGLIGNTKVILRLDEVGLQAEGMLERDLRRGHIALSHLGAAKIVPGFGVLSIESDGTLKPMDGVWVVVEEDVVEGDCSEITGLRGLKGGGASEPVEGVAGVFSAFFDVAEEIHGWCGGWVAPEELSRELFRFVVVVSPEVGFGCLEQGVEIAGDFAAVLEQGRGFREVLLVVGGAGLGARAG